jgi:hypothetical protein
MTLSITKFNITKFSIRTLSITKFSITTLSIILFSTRINKTQHSGILADLRSVTKQGYMLSVIMLNVFMLSVVAPQKQRKNIKCFKNLSSKG